MERLGIPRVVLMENAAHSVAYEAIDMADDFFPRDIPFVVLCGKGSNGGDAYAAARILCAELRKVRICEVEPCAEGTEAAANREIARRLGIPSFAPEDPALLAGLESFVAIDGVYGTGFHGDRLPEHVVALFDRIRAARGPACRVLAVDLPSGTDCDTGRVAEGALAADRTMSFACPKTGALTMPGLLFSGRVVVEPIGFPPEFARSVLDEVPASPATIWIDPPWVGPLAPRRSSSAHKGEFGRVVVCGGSPGMPGAAALAAEAAGRSGAGRVWGAVPQSVLPTCVAAVPETMWNGLEPDTATAAEAFRRLLGGKEACVVGPGLGQSDLSFALVSTALEASCAVVLDADALRCLAAAPERLLPPLAARTAKGFAPAVLTPHAGEFAALAQASALPVDGLPPLPAARALAAHLGCVVVLKGHGTVVAAADGRAFLNTTGGDGLAKGGTGDVLAGLLAGLLAQRISPAEAAACAVHIHGRAGDLAQEHLGARAMLPRDVIARLPEAYQDCFWQPRRRPSWRQPASGSPDPPPERSPACSTPS